MEITSQENVRPSRKGGSRGDISRWIGVIPG